MKINNDIISRIIECNFDTSKKINIPVMINYVPIIQLAKKPLYYTIVYKDKKITLGYTWYRNFKELLTETSSIAYLVKEVEENTIVKQLDLSDSEIPKKLMQYKNRREIVEINLISNKNGYKTKALNFITSDYEPYMSVCREFSIIDDKEVADKIAKLNIVMQSALDSYMYFVSSTSTMISVYTKLNNTVISGTSIENFSPLRASYNSANNTNMEELDNRKSEDEDGNLFNVSVPIENETVGVTYFDYTSKKESELVETKIRYNVVGLVVLEEDFGEGKISGMRVYKQVNNPYLEALMVNSKLYSSIIRKNSNLMYSRTFRVETIVRNIEIYKFDDRGELKLQDVINRM